MLVKAGTYRHLAVRINMDEDTSLDPPIYEPPTNFIIEPEEVTSNEELPTEDYIVTLVYVISGAPDSVDALNAVLTGEGQLRAIKVE